VGIGLVSMSTLLLELCLTRLLAVTLWYHFAFMIISTALLGFGAAAVLVSVWTRLREASLARSLPAFAAVLAVSIPGCFALAQTVPLEPFSISEDRIQVLWLALVYLLLTVPFFLAGVVISLLLARLTRSVTLLYAFDLIGAGLGAIAALLLLSEIGAPGALVLAGSVAAAGAAALAWKCGWPARASGILLAVLLGWLAMSANDWLPLRISHDKILRGGAEASQVLSDEEEHLRTVWSATGRIDVLRANGGWRRIVIDGGVAATRIPPAAGRVEDFEMPAEGMRAALSMLDEPRVLVIGSGGGTEVASALAGGARHVTAVEMNEAIVELVRGDMAPLGHLFDDSRVELVVDEGRSYVRRAGPGQYDLIVCAHTISNAAVSSGAVSLTENYTLTVEAFEDFLGALTEDGVLWITRPEAQLPRLVATAHAALERRGADNPEGHLLAYRRPARGRSFLGALIVSREPMSQLAAHTAEMTLRGDRLQTVLLPGMQARGGDRGALEDARAGRATGVHPDLGILDPATDDRPYFNHRIPWSTIGMAEVEGVMGQGRNSRMALEESPVAEVSVLVVLVWACVLALLFVVLPLLVWRRRGLEAKEAARLLPYFLCLGLGYVTVEICLIQRLGLFVGRPEYAMAVVLGSMLVSSGAGSLVATRLAGRARRGARLAALAVAGLVLVDALAGPHAATALLGLSLTGRMAMAAVLTAPLGFVMGMPMPLGLRGAAPDSPHLVSWAFGLNCAASVAASVLTVILSSSAGFGTTLLAAGGVYVAAALSTYVWPARERAAES